MSDYILCGYCGFRGLEIGSSVCSLCHNNPKTKKSRNTKVYLDKLAVPDETHLEEEKVELYEKYNVQSNPYKLPKHPSVLMESALLSSIPLPKHTYSLHPNGVCKSKGVSNIQGETLSLILSTFQKMNSHERAGFFLGDGTGCGKGRIIASLIQELMLSYNQNKAVWLSVSQDLENDSKRDLDDIHCNMHTANVLDKHYPESGVMFSTYYSIVKPKRYCDLCEWLGDDFQGLIALDECHKARQCIGNMSKISQKIIELQSRYPLARVIYVSATGCSQVEHMGYMTRLGLWGAYSPYEKFTEFVDMTNRGGEFANEMVAMHLKKKGCYIARSLSYKRVTTGVSMVDSSEFEKTYSQAIQFIHKLKSSGLILGKLNMLFGSTTLRFFKSLLLSFKIPKTIQMIQTCLDDNMSIVVTVQSTQETHQTIIPEEFDAPQRTLVKFIELMANEYVDKPTEHQRCLELIQEAQAIRFGDSMNVIDKIITTFGRENVAEITGRKKYSNGKSIETRTLTNNEEKELFMNGTKRVCIISEAGSVGISLHDAHNDRRRFHIILELPWSAEQFMQQCGRTHRSGQHTAPHYQLVVTDLPCEARFMSIILKRLRTLGALTNGNRFIKTEMFQLGENYESIEGEMAMRSVLEHIADPCVKDIFGTNCDKVRKFFNRMMMLHIQQQRRIFDMFHKEYLSYCNKENNKQHIHNLYVSHICDSSNTHLTNKVTLTTLDVQSQGISYSEIISSHPQKEVTQFIKSNNRSLAIAIRSHQHSDVYYLYKNNKVKYTMVNLNYIHSEYSVYQGSLQEFIVKWDTSLTNTHETIKLITGALYDIRIAFDKHATTKGIQLKRVVNPNNNTIRPILGFRISDKIESVVKQVSHQVI